MKNKFKKLKISYFDIIISNMKKVTIASIESFTGGLFASSIVSKPGASDYFKGSIVAYSNDIKNKLGIDTKNGVINKDVALEMSKKGKEFFNVDYCFSFTGNAGPNAMEEKDVGLIYIAVNENVFEFFWPNMNRNEIRAKAVDFALKELEKII